MWYDGVTEATCNERCKGTRFYRSRIQDYGWITHGNVCMLVKGEGEFYSSHGTQSCELKSNTRDLGGDCASCGNLRAIMGPRENYLGYCTRTCQAGEFMANSSTCYPCDTLGSYTLSSLNNVTQYCSSVCPGQRFRNTDGGCERCPEGYYSQGSDATECQACPDDVSGLEEGACIACGRTYINGECQACADGEYSIFRGRRSIKFIVMPVAPIGILWNKNVALLI